MRDTPIVTTFAHVKPGDMPWVDEGLRTFFQYRDLGVADATGGCVIAQLVRARRHRRRVPAGISIRRTSTSS
jgi:hypothetical protein